MYFSNSINWLKDCSALEKICTRRDINQTMQKGKEASKVKNTIYLISRFWLFNDILIYGFKSPSDFRSAYTYSAEFNLSEVVFLNIKDNSRDIHTKNLFFRWKKYYQLYWNCGKCEVYSSFCIKPRRKTVLAWFSIIYFTFVYIQFEKTRLAYIEKASTLNGETPSPVMEMAPVWIPDEDVNKCMICKSVFSIFFLNRKHHCRNCGRIICGKCSRGRRLLKHIDPNEELRVCDDCNRN